MKLKLIPTIHISRQSLNKGKLSIGVTLCQIVKLLSVAWIAKLYHCVLSSVQGVRDLYAKSITLEGNRNVPFLAHNAKLRVLTLIFVK